jgi:hypothetical protein
MTGYRWRLSRPAWIAGAAATAVALYAATWALGWIGDVNGTCWAFGRISIVVAAGVAAPLRDRAASVLDVTPYARRKRRLIPPLGAALVLGGTWLALAVVQATRVRGVPWGGLALEAVAMVAVAGAVGALVADRVDPGLAGAGTLTLIVLIDETTGIGPWLTAWPGPHWTAGRTAWAVFAVVATAVTLAALRDPAVGRRRYPRTALR